MPMYEYRCLECGTIFEKLRRAQDADQETQCPECDSEDVQRMLSAFATSGYSCGPSAGGGGGFR